MADARQEHFDALGWFAAAGAAAVGAFRALAHRRKKQHTLSDEVVERIKDDVIAALRKEALASIGDLGRQMEQAVTLMKAGVARIEELVADVPSMKDRLTKVESANRVTQGDITEIRGDLRRLRER